MNTLSSLLNFLGETLGANPSTLKTSSKTLVGAINEDHDRIDGFRGIYVSTSAPTSGDGNNGDIWIMYAEE